MVRDNSVENTDSGKPELMMRQKVLESCVSIAICFVDDSMINLTISDLSYLQYQAVIP